MTTWEIAVKLVRSKRALLKSLSAWLLIAAGLILAVFGLLLDYILLSSSPGISLPQLLIVVLGVALAIVGWLLRRDKFRQRLAIDLRANLGKGALIAAITLIVLELALTQLGIGTYFRFDLPPFNGKALYWFDCSGERGCRYDPTMVSAACERGDTSGRLCAKNSDGFRDDDEFVSPPAEIEQRVLLLGDSFTHGFSADLGKSFAEILDKALPKMLIWNAGYTGNGTNAALAAFESLAPLLQPQLTILGFYTGNDFIDNQFPMDSWISVVLPNGLGRSVRRYSIDRLRNPIRLDLETALHWHARAKPAPNNEIEKALGSMRLGTLLLRLLDVVGELLAGDDFAQQKAHTARYLSWLRDAAKAQGSELLILLIPTADEVTNPSKYTLAAEALFATLGIAWVDISAIVAFEDYKPTNMDPHWLNAGHAKVGELLTACIKNFFAAGSLSACDQVVIPQR